MAIISCHHHHTVDMGGYLPASHAITTSVGGYQAILLTAMSFGCGTNNTCLWFRFGTERRRLGLEKDHGVG